ncbi:MULTISPECIES: flagellar basal body-associated protein FliL [unclassified Cobetia]|uniref:flagellar basal body-associated protein FliL n=1 Tax=unclassified Cobetia TaxID=2609414 RepID=UPI002096DFCE|nr:MULTISPECIES: flagellar basal body-associated protein FliL [unclassified Cobetia]MCO7233170.1 flagellar basal body-associated protein FliL [Cobetia sp. Dlab-2-AX]MCO7236444.1 flagellar basal body-associated protein FliL [Cobetia sp. Dlab-2-U]
MSTIITTSASQRRSWLLIGVISLMSAVIAALVAVYFALPMLSDQKAAQDAEPEVVIVPPPVFMPLAPFTVNLESPRGNRLLYIGITLKMADQDAVARVEELKPELKSRLLLLLSGQSPDELITQAGKQALQGTLTEALSRPYSEGGQPLAISGVLYNDFIVQ